DFYVKDKPPHIAISVDMLDTGIDVPECVNLVFFKLVRSKTKFWQMMGRGTRLCLDLFGPGDHKTAFNVFDFCQNLEYFSQPLIAADKAGAAPLGEQIFKARLELVQQFDALGVPNEQRDAVTETLREAIASMNQHNFLVRPHLQLVEQFRDSDAWKNVSVGDLAALADSVAALPDQLDPEHEDSKRFDMLVLNAQLSFLRNEPFERQRNRVIQIAGLLEEQQTIPVIAEQLELILELGSDEWWIDVNYSMLEEMRKRLRLLVPLIEKAKRGQIFTDFEDLMGEVTTIELPGTGGGVANTEFNQFRKKAQHFLKEHLAEAAVAKVHSGQPLLPEDIGELQRILVAAGIGDDDSFAAASERAGSFGLFIRSLVGLDRAAA
ncbi:MAG: helicase-related protein, partial [Pirellulaceae bacterium]|nr:helicase-related protein [Pirellulaceae bacterium]